MAVIRSYGQLSNLDMENVLRFSSTNTIFEADDDDLPGLLQPAFGGSATRYSTSTVRNPTEDT